MRRYRRGSLDGVLLALEVIVSQVYFGCLSDRVELTGSGSKVRGHIRRT